jgi:GNAT superfamily N-acetyltransferase
MYTITASQDDETIGACFEVMSALRGNLGNRDRFIEQISRQQENEGYVLFMARGEDQQIVGVVGFRVIENLMHGLHLYVDDLVTLEHVRGQGIGTELMRRVLTQALSFGCSKVLLDTGNQDRAAHSFYSKLGFSATAARFSMVVDDRRIIPF